MDRSLQRLFSPAQTPDEMAREIARLTTALAFADSTVEAIRLALDIPAEPTATLRQRLLDQVEGMDERLSALESQYVGITARQQQELWQRRAELYAALRPRSRWVHLLRVVFPPNPGDIEFLLQKGL